MCGQKFDIKCLQNNYDAAYIEETHIDKVYNLCVGNPMYYEYCPPPVSEKSILSDMHALPPGKTYSDKHYIGFFDGKDLVAVPDIIIDYPDDKTVYIGFFMVKRTMQRMGIGSNIINELSDYVKTIGYDNIELAYAKGNAQSRAFWQRNGFIPTGKERQNDNYTAVGMRKALR